MDVTQGRAGERTGIERPVSPMSAPQMRGPHLFCSLESLQELEQGLTHRKHPIFVE